MRKCKCIKDHIMECGEKTHIKGVVYNFTNDFVYINDNGHQHDFETKKYFKQYFRELPEKLTFKSRWKFAKAIYKHGELWNNNGDRVYYDETFTDGMFYVKKEGNVNSLIFSDWSMHDQTWYPYKRNLRNFKNGYYKAIFDSGDPVEIIKYVCGGFYRIGCEKEYYEKDFDEILNKVDIKKHTHK